MLVTTTTTHKGFSPQRYRGYSVDILGILSECGGLTTREIADKIGLPVKRVYDECRRGYLNGIIDKKEGWGWCTSAQGMFVLSIRTTTTTTYSPSTEQLLTLYSPSTEQRKPTKPRQLNLSLFTARPDITDSERVVVEALGRLYEQVGQAYMVFKDEYELFEKLGLNVIDDETVLRDLVNKGCIYKLHVKGELKIGLRKGQIELMKRV